MKKLLPLFSLLLCSFLGKAQLSCNAGFTTNVTGFTASFTPAMIGDSINTNHYWSFGDNTVSNAVAPVHTYSTTGVFLARHIIVRGTPNVGCRDTFYTQVVITNTSACNIQANFAYARDSVNIRKYYFGNLTLNFLPTDSIRWSFGDGSAYNYNVNPDHIYATAGTYNVCIRVKRTTPAGTAPCISEYCRVLIVDSVPPCNLQAYFNYQYDPVNRHKVYFVNQTVNFLPTDSIRWNFGDGSAYSYTVNPDHTYANAGTYNVCIRVKRNAPAGTPACVSEYCKLVVIDTVPPCNLQAYFNYQVNPSNPNNVYFINQTVNFLPTDSIRWNFGDGTPFNYQTNPTHTYTTAGTYNVCIRVKRNTSAGTTPCVSEYCKQVIVASTTCNYVVDFSSRVDSINPRKVFFTNLSPNISGAIATWTFGDGTSSNSWNAEHTYTTLASLYNVCLKVKYSNTCIKDKCRVIQLPNSTVCTLQPYPNPTSTVINASVSLTAPTLINTRIFNSSNVVVRQQQQNGVVGFNTVSVNVAALPVGVYRIVINYGNRECKGTFLKVN
jgi:PKD repeat protein